eukprot:297664-Hanusia_phi.AAC.2
MGAVLQKLCGMYHKGKYCEIPHRKIIFSPSSAWNNCSVLNAEINFPTLQKMYPNAKFILLLRDPVSHVYSALQWQLYLRRIRTPKQKSLFLKDALRDCLAHIPSAVDWISGEEWNANSWFQQGCHKWGVDCQWNTNLTAASLHRASASLKSVWFVGVLSEWEDSICMLEFQISGKLPKNCWCSTLSGRSAETIHYNKARATFGNVLTSAHHSEIIRCRKADLEFYKMAKREFEFRRSDLQKKFPRQMCPVVKG